MKTKITLLAVFITMFLSGFSQQIPNGSFETWTNAYTPTGWATTEDLLSTLLPIDSNFFTYRDTTTFTQGRTSAQLTTDTITGNASSLVGIQPAVLSLGTAALVPSGNTFVPTFTGLPFTYRPDSIIFDYFASSPGSADSGGVQLTLSKNGVSILGTQGVATYLHLVSSWTHVAFALTQYYTSTDYPDTLNLQFVSSATQNAVVGTMLHVDGVRFGYVNQPLSVTASGTGVLCMNDSITLQAYTGGSTNYSYQWNLAGTPITGATSASYAAKAAGTFTVTIDSAGSTLTSQQVVITTDNIVATLRTSKDTVCSNAGAVTLQGVPGGGVYSGGGVTSSTFTPSSALTGLDSVMYLVSDLNGCAKSASAAILVQDCAGIDNIEANTFSVYPNPATTLLNINSNQNLAGFNLQVYDVLGRMVISQMLTGASNVINVAALANGTYIYRVADKENGVVTQSKFNVVK
jgi:hypothetical protein